MTGNPQQLFPYRVMDHTYNYQARLYSSHQQARIIIAIKGGLGKYPSLRKGSTPRSMFSMRPRSENKSNAAPRPLSTNGPLV